MLAENNIDCRLVNLLCLQNAFNAGTVTAYQVYLKLCENNLLSSPFSKIKSAEFLNENEKKKLERVDNERIKKIVTDCKNSNIRILGIFEKDYPERLRNIPAPALVLYIKGELPDIDNEPVFCIVGPRNVSEFGAKAAYSLSKRLTLAGMTVLSGGAKGCDAKAHIGALKAGGKTVAVLGCGINYDYLKENESLREQISKNGCLISEYPPDYPAGKYTFPVRNRLMSGLSIGVAVIEAGEKSGALNTASHALEQGRDVFVIPGNPTLPQYKGSNSLLRDGAQPLLDANDIFNLYSSRFFEKINALKAFETKKKTENKTASSEENKKFTKKFNKNLSKEAEMVYNYLDKQKFTVDDLLELKLPVDDILSALTELEMEHLIKALPGGSYFLI